MIEITLTPSEVQQAARVGEERHIEALRLGKHDSNGFDGETGWQVHIEGACGELVVAKCLDKHWGGSVNTFKVGGDVGLLQVRTRSRHDYDLLIRPQDRDDAVFVLVTGRAPYYRVHGWVRGAEGKQRQWWHDYGNRPPAFFVPKNALHSMDALR